MDVYPEGYALFEEGTPSLMELKVKSAGNTVSKYTIIS